MKILYCTTVLPSRRRTGGEIASQSFIDALRQAGHEVSVLGYRRPDDASPLGLGEVLVGVRPIESEGAGLRSVAWLLSALLSGRPYSCEKYVSAAYRSVLKECLSAASQCVVILDHAQVAFLASDLPSDVSVVFVAHNVEAQLYQSQVLPQRSIIRRWLLGREAELIGALETGLSERAAQTWVLTEHDARAFQEAGGGKAVIRCDLPGLARTEGNFVENEICWDAGLIGTWTWGANAQGLQWFIDAVVPLLPADLRVAVAGKGGEGIVNGSVANLGFVPDAMEFMRSCRVVCIPSVAGGGVQIKTIDAIASGRPIVATSVALRGIGDPPASVAVGDSPERFAACIADALASRAACSAEAIDWAKERSGRFERQISELIGRIDEK